MMEITLSWGNQTNSEPQWSRAVEGIVAETVTWFRNRGHARNIAIEQAALALELTPRKTRSILDGDPFAMRREEYDRTFEAFMRHLDFQTEDHLRRAEASKAKRRQMEMSLR